MTTDNSESPRTWWVPEGRSEWEISQRMMASIERFTGFHPCRPVPTWISDHLVGVPQPKPVAKLRVLRKWENRITRLHRRIGAMVVAGEDMDSTRSWQLQGNVLGTRTLQFGDSIKGRNNR